MKRGIASRSEIVLQNVLIRIQHSIAWMKPKRAEMAKTNWVVLNLKEAIRLSWWRLMLINECEKVVMDSLSVIVPLKSAARL